MMKCPYCDYKESRVLDTRSTAEGASIRRRRECVKCRERFTTYEAVEETPLMVVKKDQRREIFDRSKVLRGLIRACEKRSVSRRILEEITQEIEERLQNEMEQEISSKKIGEMVMDQLKDLDEVAYVRFASVYRQFKDISKFREELDRLQQEEGKSSSSASEKGDED